jgi:hypothetical protein
MSEHSFVSNSLFYSKNKIIKIKSYQLVHWKPYYSEKNHCKQSLEQTTLAYPYSFTNSVYKGYHILLSIVFTFLIENDAEILPAHYTWKVAFTNLIHKQSIQVIL